MIGHPREILKPCGRCYQCHGPVGRDKQGNPREVLNDRQKTYVFCSEKCAEEFWRRVREADRLGRRDALYVEVQEEMRLFQRGEK